MSPPGSSPRPYPVLAIVGPTGAGKSELGLFLARQLDGEIVNCDSIQVYRELNVGSAKLALQERAGIPHHLLDIASYLEELTAGDYAHLARNVITDIGPRGKLPIVVGGTGLYLRALFEGLSPAPKRNPALRTRLANAEGRHAGVLHRLLARIDSPAAALIHRRDVQKLIRAIEICSVAQQPASVAQRAPRDGFQGVAVLKIGLNPDRAQLRQHLKARAESMFRIGLVDETRQLLESSGSEPLPKSLKSLGYNQALQVLLGHLQPAEAIEQTYIKTCQYAKRQMTWFRADKSVHWIDGFGADPDLQRTAMEWSTRFVSAIPNGASQAGETH